MLKNRGMCIHNFSRCYRSRPTIVSGRAGLLDERGTGRGDGKISNSRESRDYVKYLQVCIISIEAPVAAAISDVFIKYKF